MPKELIGRRDEFHLELGWMRDGCIVQLASVIPEPQTADAPKNLAALVATWEDGARDPDDPHGARGIYASLDRGAINRLIRELRRARDQAFGPDE